MNPRLQQFLLDVIEDRRSDPKAIWVGRLLWVFSKVYGLVVGLRMFLYRYGILRRKTLGCMIVSVGNLTVGGTGKTPVVEMFARALREGGRRVAVLSRGYKRKKKYFEYSPLIVSDARNVSLGSKEAGDEPYMLARNLPGVAVLVGANRVRTGSHAIEKMGVDTLILDDGFQYLPLGRRVDVVLVDAGNPFGNGQLLPRGILREPPKNLSRADFIFLTKVNGSPTDEIVARIKAHNGKAPILECTHESKHLVEVPAGGTRPLSMLQGKRVAVLTAIARPESFENAVKDLGARLIARKRYPDHHRFTATEILAAMDEVRRRGAEALLITEKDAVRFPKLSAKALPVYFLRVEIKIKSGARDFTDCVARLCSLAQA